MIYCAQSSHTRQMGSWRGAHRAPDVHVLDGLHSRNLRSACHAQHGAAAAAMLNMAHVCIRLPHTVHPAPVSPELARTRRQHHCSCCRAGRGAASVDHAWAGSSTKAGSRMTPLCAEPERASQAASVAGVRADLRVPRAHACRLRVLGAHAGRRRVRARGARAGAHVQQHKTDVVGLAVAAGHADDDVAGRVTGHLRRSTPRPLARMDRRPKRALVTSTLATSQGARALHSTRPALRRWRGGARRAAAGRAAGRPHRRAHSINVHTEPPLSPRHQQHQGSRPSTGDRPGAPQQGG